MQWFVRQLLAIGLVTTCVFILTSCAMMMVSSASPDAPFCSVAKPIIWDDKDTDYTIFQAKLHNAVGVELCKWKGN